jgi:surface antigen/LysM repeat protein
LFLVLGVIIRNPITKQIKRKLKFTGFKSNRQKKRFIRFSIVTGNIGLLLLVAFFVFGGSNADTPLATQASVKATDIDVTNPLDQLSSADIAVHAAQMVQLEETRAVVNNADSVNAQLAIVPTDSQVVAKPQIVSTGLKSKKDIKTYTTIAGDSVTALAQKYGVTSDSIKWSNDLSADSIPAGRTLRIPPVNGIVYQVKPNDTPDTLASKFKASKDQIVAFNDAEITGLVRDDFIVIPDGTVTVVQVRATPSYNRSNGFAFGGSSPIWGGANGYDYGYCTWYAASKRAAIGRPVPSNLGNASTWLSLARAAGLATGSTPQAGAVIWTPPRDYYGHVGFVDSVDPDGTTHVSEMNVAGWNRVSTKTLTAAQAANYGYIY